MDGFGAYSTMLLLFLNAFLYWFGCCAVLTMGIVDHKQIEWMDSDGQECRIL